MQVFCFIFSNKYPDKAGFSIQYAVHQSFDALIFFCFLRFFLQRFIKKCLAGYL